MGKSIDAAWELSLKSSGDLAVFEMSLAIFASEITILANGA
jgi:hypothetical protein